MHLINIAIPIFAAVAIVGLIARPAKAAAANAKELGFTGRSTNVSHR
jgi:hypothetical protein